MGTKGSSWMGLSQPERDIKAGQADCQQDIAERLRGHHDRPEALAQEPDVVRELDDARVSAINDV